MQNFNPSTGKQPHQGRPKTRAVLAAVLLLLCAASGGCTAMSNPVADGIPVRLLPAEILGPSKTCYQTIPLNLLRQPPSDTYKLDAGDVLGVFIDGYVGDKAVLLPVQVAPLVRIEGQNRLPPGVGYPIPVQDDGMIGLPAVPKLSVKGLTVGEAREAILKLYVDKELIRKENDRILVTLLHPRQYQVLVFRQEASGFQAGQDGPIPISKRNTGHLVDLPAYKNDVLHALVHSGGLPEMDAYNEIVIYRDKSQKTDLMKQLEKSTPGSDLSHFRSWIGETTRIPLRTPQGAPLPFNPNDIVLHNGDVIFLETREEQAFFTAGLLPPGKHTLPRDHDLDVLEAIALVRGPLYNGAFGGSNLAGPLVEAGLGSPSPSLLTVLRRVPGRGQVPIAVDLRAALLHPQERLVIRPGDVLLLEEKPGEALVRVLSQSVFNFDLFLNVLNSKNGVGIIDIAAPDRLNGTRVVSPSNLP